MNFRHYRDNETQKFLNFLQSVLKIWIFEKKNDTICTAQID